MVIVSLIFISLKGIAEERALALIRRSAGLLLSLIMVQVLLIDCFCNDYPAACVMILPERVRLSAAAYRL